MSGKDKGKSGVIERSFPKTGKIIIGGINIKKVAEKSKKKEGKGAIIERAYPIDASNVKLKNQGNK